MRSAAASSRSSATRDWLLADGPTMPDLLLGNVATWGDDIDGIETPGPRLAGLVARVAAL